MKESRAVVAHPPPHSARSHRQQQQQQQPDHRGHNLQPSGMYSARLRKLYQIKAITGETNVDIDDDDLLDDTRRTAAADEGMGGGISFSHHASGGDDSSSSASPSPSRRGVSGGTNKKGDAPAAIKNLHQIIHRRRKERYEARVHLLQMERSMLPSQLSNDPDNSKILEDVIRRQNNTLAASSSSSSSMRRSRRNRGNDDGGGDDEEDGDDSSYSSGDDDEAGVDGDVNNNNNNNNNRGIDSPNYAGGGGGGGGGGGDTNNGVNSPSSSANNHHNNRGGNGGDEFLPQIMRGRNVDLTKAAEQAALAAQMMMDTQKSLAKDARYLLMGAVHNSNDAVRRFHALYTHGDYAQPNPPLPELPRVEETHSHRARGASSSSSSSTRGKNSSRGGGRGRGGAAPPSTADDGSSSCGGGGDQTIMLTAGGGAQKDSSSSTSHHHHNRRSAKAIEEEKRRAVNFLFMTECPDPEMSSLLLPPNREFKSTPASSPSPEAATTTTTTTGGGGGGNRRRSSVSFTQNKNNVNRSNNNSNDTNNRRPSQTESEYSASSSNALIRGGGGGGGSGNNNNSSGGGGDGATPPMTLFNGEPLFPASPASAALAAIGGGGGDGALVLGGTGTLATCRGGGGSEKTTIDDLLAFDRKKNVDKHHQSYRAIPVDSQPKFPHLVKLIGSARKVRKFSVKVKQSAVEFGRHGLVELRRAWNAQHDFRQERKKVMNELLEDHHLQFTAPQRVLHTVRNKMKSAAFAKDHNERLNYFFEHIKNVRPFIDELFPKKTGPFALLSSASSTSHAVSQELGTSYDEKDHDDNNNIRNEQQQQQRGTDEMFSYAPCEDGEVPGQPPVLLGGISETSEEVVSQQPSSHVATPKQQQQQQQQQQQSASSASAEPATATAATTTVLDINTSFRSAVGAAPSDNMAAALSARTRDPTVFKKLRKEFGKVDMHAMAHEFLDELHKTIIEYDGVTSLAQLDEVFPRCFDHEHIHLEHVVNLLALVAPLFGASETEFAEWVRQKRHRHEGRDKAVVVQVAKSSIISTTSSIDAHFTLFVHACKGVWKIGANLNRCKAYLRFFSENRVMVTTPRAPLKNCTWGDDAVYNVTLQDHNSTIYIQLIIDNEVEIATGTFSVSGIPWKRMTNMTIPMKGQQVDGCSLTLSVEMDFPHVLGPAMRRKINANATLPLEMQQQKQQQQQQQQQQTKQ